MTEEDFRKIIDSLKVDLRIFEEMILEVSADIRNEGFSEYPVFIATEVEIKMGELILDKNDHSATFSIYATTLEELMEKNLVLPDKKENFTKTYKDPSRFMCVMLIASGIASFVFVPYTTGGSN